MEPNPTVTKPRPLPSSTPPWEPSPPKLLGGLLSNPKPLSGAQHFSPSASLASASCLSSKQKVRSQ